MIENLPPVIDSCKVLFYADTTSDVEFTDRINLHVGSLDGEFNRVREQPYLIIAQPYSNENEYLLMFCSSSWETVGVINFASLNEAKLKAEKGYKGISEKWRSSPFSEKEILNYLRDEYEVDPGSEWWKDECSFCEKSSELEMLIKGARASICKGCIDSFASEINESI